MCGIAGAISPRAPITAAQLRRMGNAMKPRGPDSGGEWIGAGGMVGLAHRRLAVIDPGSAGHQPMVSACGRYALVCNGEIYNHAALRAALDRNGQAPPWRGHCDTEVLLAAIAAWGLRTALERAVGMFALALWDERARTLSLARDRFGEKPLYYGWVGGRFAFGSTLAPLRALPGFANPVDPVALATMLTRSHVPAPRSIHAGIFKLPQGCLLTVPAAAAATPLAQPPEPGERGALRLGHYFDHAEQLLAGAADPITDAAEAAAAIEAALEAAVRRQLVADVPVGLFLSGGVDSSLVAVLASRAVSTPLRTFTIGFDDPAHDEAGYAAAVAARLQTDHQALRIGVREACAVIPALPAIYDEPFADNSQIPTHLLSTLARGAVTVALSGDGGDELFGGYPRYGQLPRLWRAARAIPPALRGPLLRGGSGIGPAAWTGAARALGRRPSPRFGATVRHSLRQLGTAADFAGFLDGFQDPWTQGGGPLADPGIRGVPRTVDPRLGGLGLAAQMMHADTVRCLADGILAKVDRAAMAVGLETRLPFLDPAVAALAARIPVAMKVRGDGKAIVRRLLARHLPAALVDRPKAGFGVPLGEWLRGGLRDWAEDLLALPALRDEGLLEPAVIRRRWEAHLAGREDAAQPLWNVLMYQAWRQAQR